MKLSNIDEYKVHFLSHWKEIIAILIESSLPPPLYFRWHVTFKTMATLTFIFAIVVNDAPVITSDSTDDGFCSRWRRLYSWANSNRDDDVTP